MYSAKLIHSLSTVGERSIRPSIAAGLFAAMVDVGELARMMRAGVAAASQHRREQTECARSAAALRLREASVASRSPIFSQEKLEALSLMCPGASRILGIKGPTVSTTDIASLFRLALTSKIRGSGQSVYRARHAQHCAYALVSKMCIISSTGRDVAVAWHPSAVAGHSQGIFGDVGRSQPANAGQTIAEI